MTNLKSSKKHLKLTKETLRTLNDAELAQAAGGTWTVPVVFALYMGAIYYVTNRGTE
jgi:hypothetical protein